MFNNILIIGCGLIGSSILKGSIQKKLSKNFYVFEKSKKNKSVIKKISKNIKFVKKLGKVLTQMDLIVLSTPMSAYPKFFSIFNKHLSKNSIITDVGSTKKNLISLKEKKLSKNLDWVMSHPISGSEVSGPKYGNPNLFKIDKNLGYALIGVLRTIRSIWVKTLSNFSTNLIFLLIFFITDLFFFDFSKT